MVGSRRSALRDRDNGLGRDIRLESIGERSRARQSDRPSARATQRARKARRCIECSAAKSCVAYPRTPAFTRLVLVAARRNNTAGGGALKGEATARRTPVALRD